MGFKGGAGGEPIPSIDTKSRAAKFSNSNKLDIFVTEEEFFFSPDVTPMHYKPDKHVLLVLSMIF